MTTDAPFLTGHATADLESSLIGAVLIMGDRGRAIGADFLAGLRLEPDDFMGMKHRATFEAIRRLEKAGHSVDVLSIQTDLDGAGMLDAVGGPAFLGDCALVGARQSDTAYEYAAEIRDRAQGRRIAVKLDDVLTLHRSGEKSGAMLMSEIMHKLSEVATGTATEEAAKPVGEIMSKRMATIERLAQQRADGTGAAMTGIPTGVAGLDKMIGGYQRGIVTIVAGRPGHGKSSVAVAGCDAATSAGYGAQLFAMEDSEDALGDRFLSRWGSVPAHILRSGELGRAESARLVSAIAKGKSRPNLLIDNRNGLTAEEVIRSMRRHRRENNTQIVWVDYITLLRGAERRAGRREINEEQEIAGNMQALAEAARLDEVAIIVLAQLNRENEKRADRRPRIADLRGSGRLEEMCRALIGLYRGAATEDATPLRHADWECDCEASLKTCEHTPTASEFQEIAQLLVLKNNGGPTGRVWCRWHGPTMTIW